MRMRNKIGGWAIGLLLLKTSISFSATVLVTDASLLHATDQLSWGSLGANGTVINAPLALATNGGMKLVVSTGGDTPSFLREDEGTGFIGDFGPNTKLLATNSLGSLDIKFPTPVFGAGVFIEHATDPSFTGFVVAYSGNTIVGQFEIPNLVNHHLQNGSAPFIGLLSDTANITEVIFDSFGGGNTVTSGVQIAAPVPLPASWLMGAAAFPLAVLVRGFFKWRAISRA